MAGRIVYLCAPKFDNLRYLPRHITRSKPGAWTE